MEKKESVFWLYGRDSKHYPDLLKAFAVFSTIAVIAILSLVGLGIYKIYSGHIIREAEETAVEISDVILQHARDTLFVTDSRGKSSIKVTQDNFPALDALMRGYLQPLRIIKSKIYSKDKEIVYSTDKGIIGQVDAANEELEEAMEGRVSSEFETKEKVWDLENEERLNVDLIETYIPIKEKDGNVIGSFEIYTDVSRYRREIFSTLAYSLILLGSVLLASFGFLFMIMKRATKVITFFTEEEKRYAAVAAAAEVEHKKSAELKKAYNELKEAQEMLVQAEKMAIIGQFASGIAHDLKNPLTGIIFNLDLLAMKHNLNAEVNKELDEIRSHAHRIRIMADNLILFAKRKKARFSPLDINELLRSIRPLLAHHANFDRIKWNEQFEEGLPPINGDFNRLQEVFVNLGLNAYQAMPEGGAITVTTRYDREKECVEVLVSDTGQGMDKEQMESLFTSFFTTKEEGIGLGLVICRSIIEDHKGAITVQSAKGKSTTFTVTFPVAEGDQKRTPETKRLTPQ